MFKTRKGTELAQIEGARVFTASVARLLAGATTKPWKGLPTDVGQFRLASLKASGKPWVDFAGLLEVAWSSGIPVAYLPKLPITGKKMDGMVTIAGGRPVIVLTKKSAHPDWILFTLAHELGHISKGHLAEAEGASLIDESVESPTDVSSPLDQQEAEANNFAAEVLSEGGVPLSINGRLPNAQALAHEAVAYGHANHVSPGHVVLNAANHTDINGQKPFSLASAALNIIDAEIGQLTTEALCKAAADRHLDLGKLRDDSSEFLEKLGII